MYPDVWAVRSETTGRIISAVTYRPILDELQYCGPINVEPLSFWDYYREITLDGKEAHPKGR